MVSKIVFAIQKIGICYLHLKFVFLNLQCLKQVDVKIFYQKHTRVAIHPVCQNEEDFVSQPKCYPSNIE